MFYCLKIIVLVLPSAFLLTLVVFRGAAVTAMKERKGTRYALLAEELM